MANQVVIKQSNVPGAVPFLSQLLMGELALNTNDGKLYYKRNQSGTLSIAELTNSSASNLTSGTLPAARLPAFSGDVVSTAGSSVLALSPTGVVPGTYTKFSTDAKGRVLTGSSAAIADITGLQASLDSKYDSSSAVIFDTLRYNRSFQLASNTDLNGLLTSGFYDGSNLLNTPSGASADSNWWYIRVQRYSNTNAYCSQEAWLLGSSSNYAQIHVRSYQAGSWTSWKRLANTDDLVSNTNASNLTSGTLPPARLPAFAGDVTSVGNTATLVLAASGVTAGTYPKVTVTSKGIVTSGSALATTDVPTFTGAAAGSPGSKGGVPVPAAGDQTKFLRADSTWQNIPSSTDAGALVTGTLNPARLPAFGGDVTSSIGTATLNLTNTGITAGTYTRITFDAKGRATIGATLSGNDVPSFTGATPSTAGSLGGVSAPAAGDQNKFLRADNTWQIVSATTGPSQSFVLIADLNAATIDSSIKIAYVAGAFNAGDCGEVLIYQRVDVMPTEGGGQRSQDRFLSNGTIDNTNGGWWAYRNTEAIARAFGAKGDGTTPDQAGLSNMINFCNATGKDAHITIGRYLLTGNLPWITTPGVQVYGDGSSSTEIAIEYNPGQFQAPFFFISTTNDWIRGCGIRDIYFDCNPAIMTNGNCLMAQSVWDFSISNIYAEEPYNFLSLRQYNSVVIRDCRFQNIKGSYGIQCYGNGSILNGRVDRCDVLTLFNVKITGNSPDTVPYGIWMDGFVHTLQFNNLVLWHLGRGIFTTNYPNVEQDNCPSFIFGHDIEIEFAQDAGVDLSAPFKEMMMTGIYIWNTLNGPGLICGVASKLFLNNGKINACTGAGVALANADVVSLTGIALYDNGGSGIWMGSSNRISMTSCHFYNNHQFGVDASTATAVTAAACTSAGNWSGGSYGTISTAACIGF